MLKNYRGINLTPPPGRNRVKIQEMMYNDVSCANYACYVFMRNVSQYTEHRNKIIMLRIEIELLHSKPSILTRNIKIRQPNTTLIHLLHLRKRNTKETFFFSNRNYCNFRKRRSGDFSPVATFRTYICGISNNIIVLSDICGILRLHKNCRKAYSHRFMRLRIYGDSAR